MPWHQQHLKDVLDLDLIHQHCEHFFCIFSFFDGSITPY